MKGKPIYQKTAKPAKVWQPTQYSNLIRYVPSGTFFARLRVAGKLIRQSLKTDVLSIAKLRLADLEKNEREAVETRNTTSKGRMTFGDCVAIFKTQTEASSLLKPSAKLYRAEATESILKSWPGRGTTSPKPETYYISAWQEDSSILATPTARRQCIIVCGQATDKETQIFYKVLEFKTEAQIKFSIGNLIGTPGVVNYIPINASKESEMTDKLRAQVQAGVSNLTARIQFAIGQAPAVTP